MTRALIFTAVLIFGFPQNLCAQSDVSPAAMKVSLDVKTWTRSTGIADIGFKIKNENDFAIKDPIIQCNFYGNSGTVVQRLRKTLYEKIPPKKSRSIPSFVMGISGDQAATIGCAVIEVTN